MNDEEKNLDIIEPETDLVEVDDTELDEVIMSEKDARDLTESIQSTAIATCVLLQRAHDQKAWKALGYTTWADYIDTEFKFSRARSYQLLAQGKVIKEIAEASESDVYLTEKEAKAIKKELPKITEKVKEETKDIDDPVERQEKAKAIISDQIEKTEAHDRQEMESSMDDDELTEDDWRPQGGNAGAANAGLAEQHQVDTEAMERHQANEDAQQASFYLDSLLHTLDIFQALPSAESIASSVNVEETEKIEMRNNVKYAITWLQSFSSSLDD